MSTLAPKPASPTKPLESTPSPHVRAASLSTPVQKQPPMSFKTPEAPSVSAIRPQSESSLPPSPSLSQFPSSNASAQHSAQTPEENADVTSLSARSRQRYFKNMKIINEDSSLDDSAGSVAHVEYFGDEGDVNEHKMTYSPDEEYYDKLLGSEAQEKKWSPRRSEDHTMMGSMVRQPTMEEMMQGVEFGSLEQEPLNDGIPNLDDSISL